MTQGEPARSWTRPSGGEVLNEPNPTSRCDVDREIDERVEGLRIRAAPVGTTLPRVFDVDVLACPHGRLLELIALSEVSAVGRDRFEIIAPQACHDNVWQIGYHKRSEETACPL